MDIFEEEFVVPGGGTATSSDRTVTVGCTCAESDAAEIGFSLASGEKFKPADLRPSEYHSLNSNDRSYRIVLLSTKYNEARVRVKHFPREHTGAKQEFVRPGVHVLETQTSLMAELQRMVNAELPTRAPGKGIDPSVSCGASRRGILEVCVLIREESFFSMAKFRTVLEFTNPAEPDLFRDGHWVNLSVNVYDDFYLPIAKKVADSYNLKTGKSATIFKIF